MQPLRSLVGTAAPLPIPNVDTDLIIPAQCLRGPDSELGRGLFFHLRYEADGSEKPGFVLNRGSLRSSSILVAGDNFGCGSSRVHAVWALQQFGFRCVVSTSFGDIFYENAFKNGLLCAIVSEQDHLRLLQDLAADVTDVSVDLQECRIVCRQRDIAFGVPAAKRRMLLEGLDEVDASVRHLPQIRAFREQDRALRPWNYFDREPRPGSDEARRPGGPQQSTIKP